MIAWKKFFVHEISIRSLIFVLSFSKEKVGSMNPEDFITLLQAPIENVAINRCTSVVHTDSNWKHTRVLGCSMVVGTRNSALAAAFFFHYLSRLGSARARRWIIFSIRCSKAKTNQSHVQSTCMRACMHAGLFLIRKKKENMCTQQRRVI